VTALGPDLRSLWSGVTKAVCGIRPIANIPTDRLLVTHAAEIMGFEPATHFDERRLTMLDRTSQLALVAAREAMAHSQFTIGDPSRSGIILGAAIGQETFDTSYKALYGDNARRLHPMTVPRIMPNAPASHLSMEFGCQGPCFATGGCDASIVVGFMKAWDSLRVLSPDACRPFSLDRTGLVIGEAAAILVLEEWERANERGADIVAEIVGFGMSADASDLTAPNADGAARAMQAALIDAAMAPDDVDYVNAHGTGTRLNDKTECAALRKVFGFRSNTLPISSTKPPNWSLQPLR
jgi:nodulation protein E